MDRIQYGEINPTLRNARTIQALTLQDVTMGDFPSPESIANPNSPKLVYRQYKKLQAYPDRYTGALLNGSLEGYMKLGAWNIADELPFASEQARGRLLELQESGQTRDPRLTLGIFGLVVSQKLEGPRQVAILEDLLHIATDRALEVEATGVNIVLHGNDPVTPVALDQGFAFTGRIGEAAGAPGLTQRLYRKPLDS